MESFIRRPIWSIIILISIGLVGDAQRVRRITGGGVAVQGEFKYNVRIITTSNNGTKDYCTGAFISSKHVLTAAHCFQNVKRTVIHYGVVSVNDANRKEDVLEKSIPHELYQRAGNGNAFSGYDIAVGVLTTPLSKNNPVAKKIALPSAPVDKSQLHTFSGWGEIDRTKTDSKILRKMTVKILDSNECPEETMEFCGKGTNADFCHGDSGGPLVYDGQIFGVAARTTCDIGVEHIYTNVSYFLDWINEKMAENP